MHQATAFFTVIWHNYKELEFLTHERLENFYLDGLKVWVQPDLVTKNLAGEVIISDWKTGRAGRTDADNDLQLSTYIAWAGIHFAMDVEKIRAELVFLKDAQSFPTKRTKQQIDEVKAYIKKQAQGMLSAQSKDDFEPKPRFNLCKGCNFSSLCSASAAKRT